MKGKKLLTGIFSSVLLSSVILAGCNGGGEEKEKDGKVTLDVFQFKVEFKEQFENVAKEYEKKNPNVDINITTVGGGEDYGAALKSKFASGKEPAIYNVGGPQDVKDWEKKLADLSDTKAADAALEGTLDGVSKDDKVLGLPYNQEGYGFIYNKAVFEKAGIDPASITSFAKLEEAVKTLDSKKKDLGLDAVFALPGKEKWVTGLHLANAFLAPEFENNVLESFNAKTVEFKYGSQFQKVLDLQNNYSLQPTVSLDYSKQVEESFSLQKVAIIQQGNWVYGSIAGIDEEFVTKSVGILPLPVEGFKEDSIPVGVPMYWGVNSNKDEKTVKAAKDFIDWLYTSDEGKQTVLEDFKFIPAYEGYDVAKISDPLSQEVYKYSQAGKTYGWTFMGFPTGWGENVLGVQIQKYLSKEAKWDEVLNTAKQEWEKSRSK